MYGKVLVLSDLATYYFIYFKLFRYFMFAELVPNLHIDLLKTFFTIETEARALGISATALPRAY